jgi:Cell wall-active antibiotics response 4TMS YvqF/Domain of unknown function (DUF5668)
MNDRQNGTSSFQVTPQLIFGLLILFVGVVFTLDGLGVAPALSYLRYWPLAIIAVGLIKLVQSRDGDGAFVGLIITVVGVWLQAEELDLVHINLRSVWPAGLVLFGAYLVWRGARTRSPGKSQEPLLPSDPFAPLPPLEDQTAASAWKEEAESVADEAPHAERAVPEPPRRGCGARSRRDNSRMNVVAIMGGVSRGNNSSAFRGADLVAVMGGLEIDLRKAAINGEAIIDVFVMWGGIEIRVPSDWTVVTHVVPLMGGVEDKTRPPQAATAHRLTLRGVALMGGVEIKN